MDDYIRISNCSLCNIFTKKDIDTKLYYPENTNNLDKEEFVIVDCLSCKTPMIVYSEHVTSITSEAWGRILYRTRKIFGNTIKLKEHNRKIRDHIHFHVHNIKRY